jgi:hypothetical protein
MGGHLGNSAPDISTLAAIPKRECRMNFRLTTGFTVLAYKVLACYVTYTTLLPL